MSAVSEEKDTYRAGFERIALSPAAAAEPAWLRERRTAAFARFVEAGLPTPRDEAWRHTPIAPLTRARLEPADPEARPAADVLGRLARADGPRLCFVNGTLSRELSDPGRPAGVELMGLREALASRPASLEPWLARVARDASAFAAAQRRARPGRGGGADRAGPRRRRRSASSTSRPGTRRRSPTRAR